MLSAQVLPFNSGTEPSPDNDPCYTVIQVWDVTEDHDMLLVYQYRQQVQTPGLLEPLLRGAVSARSPLAALLAHRQGQPVREGAHACFEVVNVRQLGAAGHLPPVRQVLGDDGGQRDAGVDALVLRAATERAVAG